MASAYLSALSKVDRTALGKQLWEQQNGKCFISDEEIKLGFHEVDVDHVIPLKNEGKDSKKGERSIESPLHFKTRNHRHMIRWALPAARLAEKTLSRSRFLLSRPPPKYGQACVRDHSRSNQLIDSSTMNKAFVAQGDAGAPNQPNCHF